MTITGGILTTGIWPAIYVMLVAIAPLLLFAVFVHFLERLISRRLATRFGWKSVLWTGWLGTPVHELSHALFCVIFRHEIREIALFKPDLESGRLGYVHHSYRPGNLYEEIGNVFIAVAPMVGGTAALVALLMLFYPEVGREALVVHPGDASFWSLVANSVETLTTGILSWQNLKTLKFWLFIYLVVCIGSHMAPSPTDYHGAIKGSVFLFLLLMIASLLIAIIAPTSNTINAWLSPVLVPLTTVLLLVLLLCAIATIIVFLITSLTDRLGGGPKYAVVNR